MSDDARHSANPFPGLRPFRSDEDYLFFGREHQTEELLGRLRRNRFVAVVGTSGSGKSSLVRCGVLSELLGGGLIEAGSDWEVAVLQPGGDPLGNLARGLCDAGLYDTGDPEVLPNLKATLTRSRWGLVEAVRQAELDEGCNLLVVVDQFEEIFRFQKAGARGEEKAPDFVQLLLEAVRQHDVPVYVMITMRSDFLGDCARFAGLAEAVNEGEFLIPRLDRDQSQAAIEGPVRVAGATISRRLVQRLLNDLGEDPDQLPIMQHALMRTWEKWRQDGAAGSPVDLEHYEAVGRTAEALSRHADEVFAALPSDRHRQIARRVFKALTEKADDNRGIRRPLHLRRLTAVVDGRDEELHTVIDAFRQPGVTFLMPGSETELEPDTVIDIAHESLMRIWKRLGRWVEDENQSARIYRRLRETAELQRQGKAGLYHDPDLQIAQTWRDESHPNEAWADQYGGEFGQTMAFLDESGRAARQEEREAEQARQRELDQANALAETQQRAARGFRRFAVGMAAAAAAAAVAFAFALAKSREAQENADALRRGKYVSDMSLVQQALEGNNLQRANALLDQHVPGDDESDVRDWAWRYLKGKALGNEIARLGPFGEAVFCLDYSPDGRWLGIATMSGHFSLWDTESQEVVHEREIGPRSTFAFSPTENTVAFAESGSWALHRLAIGPKGELSESLLDVGGQPGWNGRPERLSFSPDGQRVAFWMGWRLFVWDVSTGERVIGPILTDGTFNFHAGRTVVTDEFVAAGTGRAFLHIHPLDPGEPLLEGEYHEGITALAVSPDGRFLAAGFGVNAREIYIFDLKSRSPSPIHVIDDCLSWICRLEFLPDGRHLVAASADQTVRVWEIGKASVHPTKVILGNRDEVYALAVTPDGTGLVTGAKDGWVRFFDLDNLNAFTQHGTYLSPAGSEEWFPGMPFSQDSTRMAVVSNDRHLDVIDTRSSEIMRRLALPEDTEIVGGRWLWYISDADSDRLMFGDGNGELFSYDLDSEQIVKTGAGEFARQKPTGSTGGLMASTVSDTIVLWDPHEMVEVGSVSRTEVPGTIQLIGPQGLIVSAHGTDLDPRVAVAALGEGELAPTPRLDLATGTKDRPVNRVALDGDERHLATSDRDGFVTLWDLSAPSPADSRRRFKPHLVVPRDVEFFPSGNRLVTTGHEFEQMKLWDVESLQQLVVFEGEGRGLDIAVSPDESVIAVRSVRSMPEGDEDEFRIDLWRAPTLEELAEAEATIKKIPVRRSELATVRKRLADAVDSGGYAPVEQALRTIVSLEPWPPQLVPEELVRVHHGATFAEVDRLRALGETERAVSLLRRPVIYEAVRGDPEATRPTAQMLEELVEWETPGNPLVRSGAVWSYLDDGSDQGTAWQGLAFDDGAWKEGAAKLGFEDGAVTTIDFGLDSNDKHITSYFRHRFELPDGGDTGFLRIGLLCDDGAVVYLNGSEALRLNLPDGEVNSETTALEAVGNEAEHEFNAYTIAARHLRPGTNLIAVEVHQAAPSSSDLGFDLKLSHVERSPESYLVQLVAGPGGNAFAAAVEALLPQPLRSDWQRDLRFVVTGELEGADASDLPDALWVRRFELRDSPEKKAETAERRLALLQAQNPPDEDLIAAWTRRRDVLQ